MFRKIILTLVIGFMVVVMGVAYLVAPPAFADKDGYVRVSGIVINGVDGTLFYHMDKSEYRIISKLIMQVQNKDADALRSLMDYDCGGGAGCYGLGHIIAQLAYDVGDENFAQMAQKLTHKERQQLSGWLNTGFAFGYDYGDDAQFRDTDTRLQAHFPKLSTLLNK